MLVSGLMGSALRTVSWLRNLFTVNGESTSGRAFRLALQSSTGILEHGA